ncbi:MAG: type VI secretion system tip protein TssI/VgrG [Planctomycetota bacterium]|nr:type VI secretion system tip protein TssI/VgrG [Planctomycetota bacterium]
MSAGTSKAEVSIECKAASCTLYLQDGTIREGLGELFEMELTLWAHQKDLDLSDIVGQPLAVKVRNSNSERWFHGIVCEFSAVMRIRDTRFYRAVVRPELWTLGQRAGCQVFESKSVSDIIKSCLQSGSIDLGSVATSKFKFDHCVQYRETDLNFVSRLMERHGLYYFFEHSQSKHKLNVASSMSDHKDAGTFQFVEDPGTSDDDYVIESWQATSRLRTSSYQIEGTTNLTRKSTKKSDKSRFSVSGASKLKVEDFEPVSEYAEPFLSELARVRIEQSDTEAEEYQGTTQGLGIEVGKLFTLAGHPRSDQCKKYLIAFAVYTIKGPEPSVNDEADFNVPCDFVAMFSAIDAKTPYRPPIRHTKPVVTGPQLATVVEETDKYGRVKVSFHWGSAKGALVSYWSRVSQNWAGKQWGGLFLPHKDHEVIVEFVDGDPDQPMVTGRVYNKDTMPPLTLPADKESSIIRDHGSNEYRMDGKEGAQRVRIYSPHKESDIIIGKGEKAEGHAYLSDGDEFIHFKGNSDETIDVNKTEEVGGDKKVTIKGKCDELTTKDHSLEVQANYNIDVTDDWTVNIGGNNAQHVIGDMTEDVDGKLTEQITKDKKVTIKGKYDEETTADYTLKTNANYSLDTADTINVKSTDHNVEASASMAQTADDFSTKATTYKLDADNATMTIKSTLEQDAKSMKLSASSSYELTAGSTTINSSGSVTIKGSKITCNGGSLEIK